MQTRPFKTEVAQLLDLVIHSLYSKKEIFLRELVSNASDAIDRARFEGLTDSALLADGEDFKITITPDKAARTLTLSDNGIGMSAEEAEANLGTIASSGTKAFLAKLKDAANKPEMIGQFGVGFYAAFMVAESVDVESLRVGAPAVRWTSSGEGDYAIGDGSRTTRGTTITLHLREGEDMDDFLEPWRIESIIKHYSDYIAYPVILVPDPSVKKDGKGDDASHGGTEAPRDDDGDTDDDKKKSIEPRTLNSQKAIWKRGKEECTAEELNTFYKHLSHDLQDPLCPIHVAAEGATEFRALLFIPSVAPFDMFYGERKHGLQLYVKTVFIGDDIKELLPDYLRFVRGVVESSDLPLNVSREMLQDDALVRRIRKTLVSKILGKLDDLQKNKAEDYLKFYDAFGRVLKEGLHSDYDNADKLKDLVLFPSTFSVPGSAGLPTGNNDGAGQKPGAPRTTLKDYVSRMKPGQKDIYILSADSLAAARTSPLLEGFAARGYEVLFFVDPIDEWVRDRLREYDGKKICAIDRGDVNLDGDLSETEAQQRKVDKDTATERFKPLMDALKAQLSDGISDVRLTSRLTESPCCLVAEEFGTSAQMERIMKAFNQNAEPSKRILEINPKHPLMEKMLGLAGETLADYIDLVYAQALLAEGTPLRDPSRFAKLLNSLMLKT